MWKVILTDKARIELQRLLVSGKLDEGDIKVLYQWLGQMEEHGPDFIAKSSEWHDHALYGNWLGYRSSAFSSSGRIIYRVFNYRVVVEIHRVTDSHNYRK